MRKLLIILFSLPLVLWTCTKDTPQEEDVPNTPVSTVVAVTSVSLDKTTLTLTEGDSFQLTETVKPDNATDKTVVWSSSNTAVANVKDGLVEAKTPGSATVYVKAGEKSASCEVTVNKKVIVVTEVKLSAQTLTLTEGDSETLTATVLPEDATDKTVTWASSDETVASVEEGVVKAIKEGKATITAKAGEKEAECVVTVAKKIIPVSAIELDQTQLALEKGQSAVLIATIKPDDATDKSVTWSSSNTTVASVDQTGKVTALAGGEAIISAKAGEQTVTCEVTVTVPVSSVTLDKTSITLEEDQGTLLTATVLPADATDKTVTWSSSAPDVASVAEGRVTALKEGTAIITAKAGEKTATCTVTVKKKIIAVISISLNKTTLGLKKGESETLIATVFPNDASDKTVSWSSSNASVASVDSKGKVTALAGGEATITAKAGEKSATCKVTVTVPVTSVTLDRQSVTLEEDQSTVLTATVNPEDASDKTVTWSSSAPEVASVAEGRVTALKEGTAIITAKAGEKTATCTVTVKKKIIAVTSISLNKTTLGLKKGESETLIATVLPNDATDKTVTWSSSIASIASVDQTGKVTALAGGEATITAKAGEKSATCKVTVTVPVESLALDVTSVTLEEWQSTLLTAIVSPTDATDKTVTWSSSNPDVATVAGGLVTAKSEGTAVITAKAGEKTATCKVTVKKKIVAVTSVVLDMSSLQLKKGESAMLSATVYPTDATDKTVTWSSSDSSIASVDKSGMVTANGVGTVNITARAGEQSAVCQVAVVIPIAKLEFYEDNPSSVAVGESVDWRVKIIPEDATERTLVWSVWSGFGDPSCVSVDQNGKITGLKEGTALVQVGTPSGNPQIGRSIYVNPRVVPVSSISIDKTKLELKKGESGQLVATVLPVDATDKAVSWSSSNPSIVSVDQTGKVTAIVGGEATITAKAGEKSATCLARVIVPVTSVSLDAGNKTIIHVGENTTWRAIVNPDDATDKTITWRVMSNPEVASITQEGVITGLSVGEASIAAFAGGMGMGTSIFVIAQEVPVTSVILNKTSLDLKKGESETLVATVLPNDATDKTVSWISSDATIVSVDQTGKVTALAGGEAMITATAGEKSAMCKVTVTVPVTSVTFDRQSVTLEEGQSTLLTATVLPEDATDKTVSWSSSNPSIASVDQNGEVTAVSVGQATISAKAGEISARCEVLVKEQVVHVTSVSLNKYLVNLTVGQTEQLTATVLPVNATDKTVTWQSSDASIATVDGGLITAVSEGEVKVTATCDGVSSYYCWVYVQQSSPVEYIVLNYYRVTLEKNQSTILTATVYPTNATDKTVTWESSDSSIASVDQTGKVVAVNYGSTVITAKAGGKSATCLIIVETPGSDMSDPEGFEDDEEEW